MSRKKKKRLVCTVIDSNIWPLILRIEKEQHKIQTSLDNIDSYREKIDVHLEEVRDLTTRMEEVLRERSDRIENLEVDLELAEENK